MKVIKVISECKKIPKGKPVKRGCKRIEAIVEDNGLTITRHIDVPM